MEMNIFFETLKNDFEQFVKEWKLTEEQTQQIKMLRDSIRYAIELTEYNNSYYLVEHNIKGYKYYPTCYSYIPRLNEKNYNLRFYNECKGNNTEIRTAIKSSDKKETFFNIAIDEDKTLFIKVESFYLILKKIIIDNYKFNVELK